MSSRAVDFLEDGGSKRWTEERESALPGHHGEAESLDEIGLPTTWARPPLTRLRFQLPLVLATTVILPGLIFQVPDFWQVGSFTSASNTFLLVSVCAIVALMLFRRLEQFPGISSFAQIAPIVAGAYGVALVAVLALRIDYTRRLLFSSAVACLFVFGMLWDYYRHRSRPIVYLLPDAPWVESARLRLHRLKTPTTDLQPNSMVAADLRSDLTPRWQRFILNAALAGIPVYDVKALAEAATGKVQISHLAENTFGSVLPSLPYLRLKRVIDVAFALVALLPIGLIMCAVAAAIKLDSRGPVFFKQERIGFRGKKFMMFKFRTMRPADPSADSCRIDAAMTKDEDARITRLGKFLRRHRFDELPQILNILKGEMSWIGPRPEAEPLAIFYEKRIPFYGYRHMVRPGITGWAQVSQGHVVEVDAIRDKLNYDFYYIKHFSAWLDALIAARTVKILLFGKGAR